MDTSPHAGAGVLGDALVLGADSLRRTVGFEELIQPVGRALAAFSRGLGEAPASVFAPRGSEGDVHVKSAWLPGHALFTVKIATWFAAGDPQSGGVIAVFDSTHGRLRALLRDDHHLSDVRTAAAGALLAQHFASPDSRVVGVLGSGVQAYLQVLAATHVLPGVETVRIWGRTAANVHRMRAAIALRRPRLHIQSVGSPADAVLDSDLLITATSSRAPLVQPEWLRPGLHITAVGADDVDKWELAPGVFRRAERLVVDSRVLACRYGDLRQAISAGTLPASNVRDELGEVVDGRVQGRRDGREVTLGKLIGLGVQDLVAAEFAVAHAGHPLVRAEVPASAIDLQRPA